mmetsp:Transcript_39833/g.119817  ORF Transcript_39833/g.119817 Transcript_39833/m.119817 type:complete len:91 (+) Transcript_39833:110-382(+)
MLLANSTYLNILLISVWCVLSSILSSKSCSCCSPSFPRSYFIDCSPGSNVVHFMEGNCGKELNNIGTGECVLNRKYCEKSPSHRIVYFWL